MKIKNILLAIVPVVLLLAIPKTRGMEPNQNQEKNLLIALGLPNRPRTAVGVRLAEYAKDVQKKTKAAMDQAGLVFNPLSSGTMHLTLFNGKVGLGAADSLIKEAQRGIRDYATANETGTNSFTNLRLTGQEKLGNSFTVTIAGPGDLKAKGVADSLNDLSSNASLPYVGHISIGRIKLKSQKGGETTQEHKDTIDALLEAHPQIMQAFNSVPLPRVGTFIFDKVKLDFGGKKLTMPIADVLKSYVIRDFTGGPLFDKAVEEKILPNPRGNQDQEKNLLIALGLPNQPRTAVGVRLAEYAKEVQKETKAAMDQAGLVFKPLGSGTMHLTLFYGKVGPGTAALLIEIAQGDIRDSASANETGTNSFTNLRLTGKKKMGNSFTVTIAGPGDLKAKGVADSLNDLSGNASQPYVGFISVGRIKLKEQSSGATTQAQKNRIDAILAANPQIMQKLNSVSLPRVGTFIFDKVQLDFGGKKLTMPIADVLKPYVIGEFTGGPLFDKAREEKIIPNPRGN